MRTQLLVAFVAVAALAGCGGDDDSETTTQKAPAVATDLTPVKDYLLDHTSRLQGDTAKLATQADAYYQLAKSENFDYGKLLQTHRSEVADQVKAMQDDLHRRQPGVRGDGGRGRRRADARRLRRDHRRGQRQVRPGERRAVHGQDAGRPHVRAARQLLPADRDLAVGDRSEVRRQGRDARPRRRRQGRVRRGRAGRRLPRGGGEGLRRPTPRTSTPRPSSGSRRPRTPSPRSW